MSQFLRFAAGLCCLGMLLLGAVVFNPAGRLLFSFRDSSGEKLSLGEELQHGDYLKQTEEALRRRREAKWHMAEEVIDRRLSLAEAMEQFQVLDRDWPPGRVWIAESLRISEDESDGQGVLIYVRFVLRSRHEDPAALLGRLEKELQELLASRPKRPTAPAEPPIEERNR